jgi:hypothetical protein
MALRAEWRYSPTAGEWVVGTWREDGEPDEVFGMVSPVTLTTIPVRVRRAVAETLRRQYGVPAPAAVFDGPPGEQMSMTCPACWSVSFNAGDARERYCGACHTFPEAVEPEAPAGDPPASVQSGQSG